MQLAERQAGLGRGAGLAICPNAVLVALTLGSLVWIPVLGSAGALGFLGAGGLLMARNPAATVSALSRYWYVLILPLYCLASTLWSGYPAVTFRFSLQLLATFAIAVTAATRLAPSTFHRALFLVFLSVIAASLLAGNVRDFDGAWLGIFGSKNALAAASATFLVLTLALLLDRHAPAGFRLLALAGLPMGLALLILAKSTGAILISAPVLFSVPILILSRRLTGGQKLASAVLTGAMLTLALALFLAFREAVFAALLDQTGKDVTLTGRTDLWRVALSHIAERPLFGLGYQAFWVQTNASAEALWRMFGIAGRGGFNFHNTYISNAVEIGLAGVAVQALLLYGALIGAGLWAVRSHRAEAAGLFALVLMVTASSFIEVPVFFQFSVTTVNVVCIFVYGIRAATERRSAP
jgi:exopolysaccharide production protein ExoQ